MPTQYYTTGDIARICDVTANGVIKWIKAGKLKAFRTPGGQRRIREEDFVEFINQFNYPVDPKYFRKSGRIRILIVDDNRDIVRLLRHYLSMKDNYDILSSYNGYEACIKAGSFQPDVMILDIMMPKVDGYEVLSQIRENEKTKNTKVIILTALNRDIVSSHINNNDVPILSKPVNMQELEKTIEKTVLARAY